MTNFWKKILLATSWRSDTWKLEKYDHRISFEHVENPKWAAIFCSMSSVCRGHEGHSGSGRNGSNWLVRMLQESCVIKPDNGAHQLIFPMDHTSYFSILRWIYKYDFYLYKSLKVCWLTYQNPVRLSFLLSISISSILNCMGPILKSHLHYHWSDIQVLLSRRYGFLNLIHRAWCKDPLCPSIGAQCMKWNNSFIWSTTKVTYRCCGLDNS